MPTNALEWSLAALLLWTLLGGIGVAMWTSIRNAEKRRAEGARKIAAECRLKAANLLEQARAERRDANEDERNEHLWLDFALSSERGADELLELADWWEERARALESGEV